MAVGAKNKSSAGKPTSTSALKSSATITPEMSPLVDLIATSSTPAFHKRVYNLLLQIPAGSFSTYGLLAEHLSTSPRAVGNALRRNPFAPAVPCHRVVATGGGLGGFKGKVGRRDGESCLTLEEKRALLLREGVRFDEKGRVVGTPFRGFVSLGMVKGVVVKEGRVL